MANEMFLHNRVLRNRSVDSKDLIWTILLGLVFLLGTVLRFYDLGSESYHIDEYATVIEGQQSIHQIITSGRLDQPPAYYLPFHFWEQFFGTTEVSTRSFSALAGIGSIVLIYLIGRDLFGKQVGLFSAFFMAISEFQIYYSQITRFYSFFEFTALLSFLFFTLALRSRRIIHFALYGVASIFMVYSHTFGVFILAAQDLFFILQGKKYRNVINTWFICQTLVILAYVPYFYPLIFGESGLREVINFQIGGPSAPSLTEPIRSVYHFIFSARRDRTWGIIVANYGAAGALLLAGTWIYAIRQGMSNWLARVRGVVADLQEVSDVKGKFILVSCWFLCPILLPLILSIVISPIYREHYTISAAPALYLLLAFGLFSIRKLVPIILSLGVLLIMIIPSLGHYYVTDVQEQWKEVAIYVKENYEPDEVIVFASDMGIGIQQRTFNWYYQGTLPDCGLVNNIEDPLAISETLLQCTTGYTRFWIIVYDPAYNYISFFENPNQTAMHLIKKHYFVGVSVYLFEWTK